MDLPRRRSAGNRSNRGPRAGGRLVPKPHIGPSQLPGPLRWLAGPAGLVEIGHPANGRAAFHIDNELPVHRVWLEALQPSPNRLVRNRDYATHQPYGGYQRPELWLSARLRPRWLRGWQAAPLLREQRACLRLGSGNSGLAGAAPCIPRLPFAHLSWFLSRRLCPLGRWPAPSGRVGGPLPAAESSRQGQWLWRADRRVRWAALLDGQSLPPLTLGLPAAGAVYRGRIYKRQFMSSQMDAARRQFLDAGAKHAAPPYRNFFPPRQPRYGQRPFRLAGTPS